MPQLDKTTFHHQIVYVSLALILLYSILSFVVMPELFSNILTRRLLVLSSKESWDAGISKRIKNSRIQKHLLEQASESHLEYYETIYESSESFLEQVDCLKKQKKNLEKHWKTENLILKADIFSLKKLL